MALHDFDVEALGIVVRRGVVADPNDAHATLGERVGTDRADITEAMHDRGRATALHADTIERPADEERDATARGLAPAERATGGDGLTGDDLVDGLALI